MEVFVPFSADRPKSRLSTVLTSEERASFAQAMLRDVLDAVVAAGGQPRILATGEVDSDVPHPVVVDNRPLTTAVNAALGSRSAGGDGETDDRSASPEPIAVVMADLALATPEALNGLFEAVETADITIAPGRGGGTNAVVVDHPGFRVDYHGASYVDHRRIAEEIGASVRVVDSHRLATDVDEPSDLAELLIHGDGASVRWLEEAGFTLDTTGGRVGVVRE